MPYRVGCSVMSVSQSWFGVGRWKFRRSRSSDIALAVLAPFGGLLFGIPLISSSTMIEPTVFWPIGFPRPNRSSAETLGTPWVPRDCLWISVISFAVQTRLSAVRESGRFFRA